MNTMDNTTEILEWIKQTGEESKGFITEQAPLYAKEIIQWELVSGVIALVVALILVITSITLLIKIKNHKSYCDVRCKEQINSVGETYIIISVFSLGLSIFLTIFGSMSIIKSQVAPRAVIMEHVKGLTK